MKNEALLHEEIESELSELNNMEIGSDKYKIAVEGITKLMDRAIELEKQSIDSANKENELSLKEQQMADDRKDKKTRNIITVAGIVVPLTVETVRIVWGVLASMKFEKVDSFTSSAGRSFMNQLFRKG